MQNIERIVLRTENTTVVATDQPTHGNACHKYEVRDPMGGLLGSFHFQEGPIKEAGINGVQHAELLAIIRDRKEAQRFLEGRADDAEPPAQGRIRGPP